MSEAKLQVAFLWHQHQPYYKNIEGYYHMPWVRFHGTKDYLDMLLVIKEFPEIKQNINLVPSLLLQIKDYVENNAKDNIWLLTEVPAENLSFKEKLAILDNFFLANPDRMIKPYPRYYELYVKNKFDSRYLSPAERVNSFSTQDFLDLQMWYNMCWIGMVSRQRPLVKELFEKGKHFTENDKQTLLSEIRNILKEILPLHKTLWEQGQIELSTTPFYHPIVPLLIDNSIARESAPEIDLPTPVFRHPEDAEAQIKKGLEYFENVFGRRPVGMWPSEGSVSDDALQMFARQGIKWVATDEAILARTVENKLHPNRIYIPYLYQKGAQNIHIFFRDHNLSDAIGFVYGSWDTEKAVNDFINRLYQIRKRIVDEVGESQLEQYIVSIILDGENCWEYYPEDGKPFLRLLFQRLSEDPVLKTCTFEERLQKELPSGKLHRIFPGSWINANFTIWIGSSEDNRAWELLKKTRDFLVEQETEGNLPSHLAKEAWEHIYIAEGSDWCWWYGDEHSSSNDLEFDELFRQHLIRVYEIVGAEIPSELYQTIKQKHFDRFTSIRPLNFITPILDGKESHYYEWVGAAVYEATRMEQAAMHQVSRIIDKFYVGFDKEYLYFRIDFAETPDLLYDYVLSIKTPRQITVVLSPLRGIIEKFEPRDDMIEKVLLEPSFKLEEIFEARLSFADLNLHPGELMGFQFQIKKNGQLIETFPHTKIVELEIPDEHYELREWSV
ncbi:MAG: glycoside hydrolase [Calditrichaeota bacterium]|nr:MAG: glycoside hydrolase [Calditrichota bacterium]